MEESSDGFYLTANESHIPARKGIPMIPLRSKRSRPYALNQQAELEARATLLARARKGDSDAQANLIKVYGVRVYSEAEREHTTVMGFLTQSTRATSRK